jgi:hypothetical protein
MAEHYTVEAATRQSIALLLYDCFRWTKPGELLDEAAGREVFEGGLRLLFHPEPITTEAERDLLTALLEAGWNACPAADDPRVAGADQ